MAGEADDQRAELLRRAEHAEAELRQFASAVSHDLRSPLASIVGYAELLQLRYADALDDEGRRYLDRVEEAAGTLHRMLSGLAALSRLPVTAERRPVALPPLVDQVLAELDHELAPHLGAIHVEPSPTLQADEELLYQLLSAVLDNALRHHPTPDDARVVVRTAAGGGLVIEDDGEGVPDHRLDRLVDAFEVIGARGPRGGVGLAIADHVAQVHGGRLTLSRSPLGGLRVSVSLGG